MPYFEIGIGMSRQRPDRVNLLVVLMLLYCKTCTVCNYFVVFCLAGSFFLGTLSVLYICDSVTIVFFVPKNTRYPRMMGFFVIILCILLIIGQKGTVFMPDPEVRL